MTARVEIRFILHRPRNSQNIGSAARALSNTGAGPLWVVEPVDYDRTQAVRLAAGADDVLEAMRVVPTLDQALAGCVDVVMTTGREIPGAIDPPAAAARLLAQAGPVALVFGDEVNGLTNHDLARANAVATIPTVHKPSLNLAQAVLIFGWEILKARGHAPLPAAPEVEPAEEKLLALIRGKSRELLLSAGFLNPQQPDRALDELLGVLRRARPSRREAEMLMAALLQLGRRRS